MEFLYLLLIIFILLSIAVFLYIYNLDIKSPLRIKVFNSLTAFQLGIGSKYANLISSFKAIVVTMKLGKLFGLVVVPSEKAWIVDRYGTDRLLEEGIQRFNPLVDKLDAEVDLKEFRVDPADQDIMTKDNINLNVDMIATAIVLDPMKAIKNVNNFKEELEALVVTSTFSKLSQFKFTEIQEKAETLPAEIKALMEKDCKERWGIEIKQVKFESIKPPQDIVEAMSQEIIAERKSNALIKEAQGQHQAQELRADSERIFIQKRAEAMHTVISNLQTILKGTSDEKLMQFLTSNAYIESMKTLSESNNSKFVLYPSDVQQPIDKVMNAEYLSQSIKKNNN
ncbi:MAG: Putative stomatin/prohibitin-family membrane protease subunit YbbK [uncultured Sulfurovum sp.]|uniref:Stomatin/prohibitin-family membrane protease subunit YbbK n=1 Tax=uncultured Sulfurovum sp. TaxID=269237 RepID=A0A6S6TWQ5_9BACT|nr:MAG: Putative stomatin/prohibitin-family membrane protease subunit YbbK [uncultured Sulfurovum sp.]